MSLDRLERRRSVSASRPACAHVLHVHVANHRANCGHQTRRPLARVRPIVNVSWAGAALAYDRGRDILGESARRSTTQPLYCALMVVGMSHIHHILTVGLVARGRGERRERVAPQASPRTLAKSGKEIRDA